MGTVLRLLMHNKLHCLCLKGKCLGELTHDELHPHDETHPT